MATSRNDLVLTGGALGLLMALYLTLGDPWQQAHAPLGPSLPNLQCQEEGLVPAALMLTDAAQPVHAPLAMACGDMWGGLRRVTMPTTSWLEQADTLPTLTDHPLHALRTYTMLHTTLPSQRLGHRCPACGSATAVPPVRKFREG